MENHKASQEEAVRKNLQDLGSCWEILERVPKSRTLLWIRCCQEAGVIP